MQSKPAMHGSFRFPRYQIRPVFFSLTDILRTTVQRECPLSLVIVRACQPSPHSGSALENEGETRNASPGSAVVAIQDDYRNSTALCRSAVYWTAAQIGDGRVHTVGSSTTAWTFVPDRRHVRLINRPRGVERPEQAPTNYIKGKEPLAPTQSYENNFQGS